MKRGDTAASIDLSFDPARLDVDLVHRFLSTEAYWCLGIPRAIAARAIANSLRVGAYLDGPQVGFARLVTDRATFADLADVFVVAHARGRRVATQMERALLDHEDVRDVRRCLLFTADAHAVYRGLGFQPIARPERGMEILRPDVYRAMVSAA